MEVTTKGKKAILLLFIKLFRLIAIPNFMDWKINVDLCKKSSIILVNNSFFSSLAGTVVFNLSVIQRQFIDMNHRSATSITKSTPILKYYLENQV